MSESLCESNVSESRPVSGQHHWSRLLRWCRQLRCNNVAFAENLTQVLSTSDFERVDTRACLQLVAEFLSQPPERLVKIQCVLCILNHLCSRNYIMPYAASVFVNIISSVIEHTSRLDNGDDCVKAVHCILSDLVCTLVSLDQPRLSSVYVKLLVNELLVSGRSLEVQRELLCIINKILEDCDRQTRTNLRQSLDQQLQQMIVLLEVCGDYDVQCSLVESLIRFSSRADRQQLAERWFPSSSQLSELFVHISCFDVDCRRFLNTFNARLGSTRLVHSFPAVTVFLAELQIRKPRDVNYSEFWVDVNEGSGTIFIYCDRFSNEFLSQDASSWDVVLLKKCDVVKVRLDLESDVQVVTLTMSESWQESLPQMFSGADKSNVKLTFHKVFDVHSVLNRIFIGKYRFVAPCLSPLTNIKASVPQAAVRSTSSVAASVHSSSKASVPVQPLQGISSLRQERVAVVKSSSPTQSLQVRMRGQPEVSAEDSSINRVEQQLISSASVISDTQRSAQTAHQTSLPNPTTIEHCERGNSAVGSCDSDARSSVTLVGGSDKSHHSVDASRHNTVPCEVMTEQLGSQHNARAATSSLAINRCSPTASVNSHISGTPPITGKENQSLDSKAENALAKVQSHIPVGVSHRDLPANSSFNHQQDEKLAANKSGDSHSEQTSTSTGIVKKQKLKANANQDLTDEHRVALDGQETTSEDDVFDNHQLEVGCPDERQIEKKTLCGGENSVVCRKRSLYSSTDVLIEVEAHSQSDQELKSNSSLSNSHYPVSIHRQPTRRKTSVNNKAHCPSAKKEKAPRQKTKRKVSKRPQNSSTRDDTLTNCDTDKKDCVTSNGETASVKRPCRSVTRNKCYYEHSDSSSEGQQQSQVATVSTRPERSSFHSANTLRNSEMTKSERSGSVTTGGKVRSRRPRQRRLTAAPDTSSSEFDAVDTAVVSDMSHCVAAMSSDGDCGNITGAVDSSPDEREKQLISPSADHRYQGIFDNIKGDDDRATRVGRRYGRSINRQTRQRHLLYSRTEDIFDNLSSGRGGGDSTACQWTGAQRRSVRSAYSGRRVSTMSRGRHSTVIQTNSFNRAASHGASCASDYRRSLQLWSGGATSGSVHRRGEVLRGENADSEERNAKHTPPPSPPAVPGSSSGGSSSSVGSQLVIVTDNYDTQQQKPPPGRSEVTGEERHSEDDNVIGDQTAVVLTSEKGAGDDEREGPVETVQNVVGSVISQFSPIDGEKRCLLAQSLQLIDCIRDDHSRINQRIDSLQSMLKTALG